MDSIEAKPLRFPDVVRRQIKEEYVKQKSKQGWLGTRGDLDDSAEGFINILESFSEAIPEFQKYEPPKQQRRKEQLRSIALHLSELAQQLAQLDSAALGYWVHCSETERERRTGEDGEQPGSYETMEEAFNLRAAILPMLNDLSLGAQIAQNTLPLYQFDYYLKIALAVERQFWEHQLKFSVTETGLSAMCLRAIFEAGGLKDAAIKYWLKLARDNEESMTSLTAKLKSTAD